MTATEFTNRVSLQPLHAGGVHICGVEPSALKAGSGLVDFNTWPAPGPDRSIGEWPLSGHSERIAEDRGRSRKNADGYCARSSGTALNAAKRLSHPPSSAIFRELPRSRAAKLPPDHPDQITNTGSRLGLLILHRCTSSANCPRDRYAQCAPTQSEWG
jgi:hypothetical protein